MAITDSQPAIDLKELLLRFSRYLMH